MCDSKVWNFHLAPICCREWARWKIWGYVKYGCLMGSRRKENLTNLGFWKWYLGFCIQCLKRRNEGDKTCWLRNDALRISSKWNSEQSTGQSWVGGTGLQMLWFGSKLVSSVELEGWWTRCLVCKCQGSHWLYAVGVRGSRLWLRRQSHVKIRPAILDQKVNSSKSNKVANLPLFIRTGFRIELAMMRFSSASWEMKTVHVPSFLPDPS